MILNQMKWLPNDGYLIFYGYQIIKKNKKYQKSKSFSLNLSSNLFVGLELPHQIEIVAALLWSNGYFRSFQSTVLCGKVGKINLGYWVSFCLDKCTLRWFNPELFVFVVYQLDFEWSLSIFQLDLKCSLLSHVRTDDDRFVFWFPYFKFERNSLCLILQVVKCDVTFVPERFVDDCLKVVFVTMNWSKPETAFYEIICHIRNTQPWNVSHNRQID